MKIIRVDSRLIPSVLVVGCIFALSPQRASALSIIPNFIGGAQPGSTFGGGNLETIFQSAADVWESLLPTIDHTVQFDFGWGNLGPGVVGGQHILIAQGGSPNREIRGEILFNNGSGPIPDPMFAMFLDPTPLVQEEFDTHIESTWDFGTGPINTGRLYEGFNGQYPCCAGLHWVDLFSVALHEIGHGLGMSAANTSWIEDAKDGDIDIRNPALPFTGFSIPLASNNAGLVAHFDPLAYDFAYLVAINNSVMSGGPSFFSRELPSELDVLALRQLNSVPEPSVLVLVAMGVGLVARRRRWTARGLFRSY